jgi:hypothetical protein
VVTERGLADLYQLLEDDVNLPEETVEEMNILFLVMFDFLRYKKSLVN